MIYIYIPHGTFICLSCPYSSQLGIVLVIWFDLSKAQIQEVQYVNWEISCELALMKRYSWMLQSSKHFPLTRCYPKFPFFHSSTAQESLNLHVKLRIRMWLSMRISCTTEDFGLIFFFFFKSSEKVFTFCSINILSMFVSIWRKKETIFNRLWAF